MGWLDTDNRTISVQLNLTGTATGTELGNISSVREGSIEDCIIHTYMHYLLEDFTINSAFYRSGYHFQKIPCV